ncbi:unnamed protein product [Soboliphyme baturini]|uniref:CBFD_NFYB_HMF domain-containing protein n=1 Tax=Soboliphyme baturini TaxID=241478 RepID=A0A183IKQ7_9BILA|nr:unnamed protein product [Soboliphyme baturini]
MSYLVQEIESSSETEDDGHGKVGSMSFDNGHKSGDDSSSSLPVMNMDMPMNGSERDVLREQDRFLPIANVSRIMKRSIPENGKIAKDGKECCQECVSEFLSFLTGEASERCLSEKRKTINGEDLLWAMQTLGFENYVEPLKLYLAKYRCACKGEKLPENVAMMTTGPSPSAAPTPGQEGEMNQPVFSGSNQILLDVSGVDSGQGEQHVAVPTVTTNGQIAFFTQPGTNQQIPVMYLEPMQTSSHQSSPGGGGLQHYVTLNTAQGVQLLQLTPVNTLNTAAVQLAPVTALNTLTLPSSNVVVEQEN